MNNIIDLSHIINEKMPVYPGTEAPRIEAPCTVEKDGFYERKLTFYSHTGTHMDAPAHLFTHAPTLDMMPIGTFIGPASVIDLTELARPNIELAHLEPFTHLFESSDFILLHTGWSRYWGQEKYFSGFPVLTQEAALWIHCFDLKGIGVDTISVDAGESSNLPVHKILLERSVLIENLVYLDELPQTGFTFCCFPLKLEAADGSPVRAVALV